MEAAESYAAGEHELASEFVPQHEDPAQIKAHIDRLHMDLPRLGHYELLGLTPEASHEQIQKSFYDLALLMHPDRHFSSDDEDLKDSLQAIYKRAAECYQVLMNPASRREYDVALRLAEREEYEAARSSDAEQLAVPEPEPEVAPLPTGYRLVMLDDLPDGPSGGQDDGAVSSAAVTQQQPQQSESSSNLQLITSTPGPTRPVDVVLEDTAPRRPQEALPTPVSLRPGEDEDNLPAASEPAPDPGDDLAAGSLARPRPETPQPSPAPSEKSRDGRRHSARLEPVKSPRPMVRILVGVLVALAAGAVVPGSYTGWIYFARIKPLQLELHAAEDAAGKNAIGMSSQSGKVESVDRRLFEVIWTHLLFTCVFWGILSVIVGTMWFRRH